MFGTAALARLPLCADTVSSVRGRRTQSLLYGLPCTNSPPFSQLIWFEVMLAQDSQTTPVVNKSLEPHGSCGFWGARAQCSPLSQIQRACRVHTKLKKLISVFILRHYSLLMSKYFLFICFASCEIPFLYRSSSPLSGFSTVWFMETQCLILPWNVDVHLSIIPWTCTPSVMLSSPVEQQFSPVD